MTHPNDCAIFIILCGVSTSFEPYLEQHKLYLYLFGTVCAISYLYRQTSHSNNKSTPLKKHVTQGAWLKEQCHEKSVVFFSMICCFRPKDWTANWFCIFTNFSFRFCFRRDLTELFTLWWIFFRQLLRHFLIFVCPRLADFLSSYPLHISVFSLLLKGFNIGKD